MKNGFVLVLVLAVTLASPHSLGGEKNGAVASENGRGGSSASLEDTLAWLKGKVDSEAGWATRKTRGWARWDGQGCAVRIEKFSNLEPEYGGGKTAYASFSLADISHAELDEGWEKLGKAKVMIYARSGNPITSMGSNGEQRFGAVNLDFFANFDIARRVAAALTHAAKLCSANAPREVF